MVQQRLPIVNSDDGAWGDILNLFLSQEHYNTGSDDPSNGMHQTITVRPGTTAANTAPLTFTSGSLMTTPQAGAIEFLTDRLYFTQTTSTVRKVLAAFDDTSGATGDVYYRDSSGNFVRLGIGGTNQVLTVIGGLPSWQTATSGGITRSIVKNVGGGVTITAGNTANTDYVYHIDNNLQLPDATLSSNSYQVRNIGSTTINVLPNGAQTVAEVASFPIRPFDSWEFISDKISNWGTF